MESVSSLWLVPVSIVPGLGMLVLSTSSRYMTVTLQLREQGDEATNDPWLAELIYKRACCLQRALLGLYLSIGMFMIASLLMATVSHFGSVTLLSKGAMLLGGLFALYSTTHLVYEAYASRRVIDRDHEKLKGDR